MIEQHAFSHTEPGAVLTYLERLQSGNTQNYLPLAQLKQTAHSLGLPLSQIYSVVTFYAFFNLAPQGKHTVTICRGTACHTRGSRLLLDALETSLGFGAPGDESAQRGTQTTADGQLTVRTVACFGQCALAPVVEIDRVIHGHMNQQKLLSSVKRLEKQGAQV